MKKPLFTPLVALSLLGLFSSKAHGQSSTTEVIGTVQTDSGEPLPGATVFIKGTYIGGTTNSDGMFRLQVPNESRLPVLNVSFLGYETQQDTLRGYGSATNIVLVPSVSMGLLNEVVISASRIEENIMRAPVTVDKLNSLQLGRLTKPDLLQGLAQQKGVDVTTSGMFMSSLSSRGFNSATSERLVQLVDYMDTQSPSLNINAGNSLGLPEVDIASVEVLHGPSSALYGANAFNGVVLLNSKDPFTYEGLSLRLRGGNRDYLDGQLRYAVRLGRKWAFKVSGSYAQANDWIAENYGAQSSVVVGVNNPAGSNKGYDGINIYGDVGQTFDKSAGKLAGQTVFMPGFTERELIADDNRAKLYRVVPSLSFLLTNKVKATVEAKFAQGTTSYQQTNRYRLQDFATHQFRAEVKAPNWYVRAYQTQDWGNNTYDMSFLGSFMQTAIDPRFNTSKSYAAEYFGQYALTYNTFLANPANAGNTAGAEAAARAAAAKFQLVPGTPEFNELRATVKKDGTPTKGARVNPSSLLTDVSAQRDFKFRYLDLIVGGAYRQYRLGSSGLLFSDTDGERIKNFEYGAYGQLSKELLNQRLKLTFAGRVDEFRNFKAKFSPRGSVVYALGADKQHNLRASYNQAFRSPTQQGQYLQLDLQRVLLLGNVGNGFSGYSTALGANLGTILSNPATAQAELAKYAVSLGALKPERVSTLEVGYKGSLAKNVLVDVNYYRSDYNDFIGQTRLITNVNGTSPTTPELAAGGAKQYTSGTTRVIQIQANAAQRVRTSGSMVAVTYTPTKVLNVTGNYTLNLLERDNLPADFLTYYNTPKNKYNVGVFGEVAKVVTYSANYRWAQGHLFESPFAIGELKSFSSLDAQLGYTLPKLHTTLQVGGSNLANARNMQVYGGPQVGRMAYAGLSIDVK
jgi:iron complex outermembrane receptor protein